jgi:hypothetical protein
MQDWTFEELVIDDYCHNCILRKNGELEVSFETLYIGGDRAGLKPDELVEQTLDLCAHFAPGEPPAPPPSPVSSETTAEATSEADAEDLARSLGELKRGVANLAAVEAGAITGPLGELRNRLAIVEAEMNDVEFLAHQVTTATGAFTPHLDAAAQLQITLEDLSMKLEGVLSMLDGAEG